MRTDIPLLCVACVRPYTRLSVRSCGAEFLAMFCETYQSRRCRRVMTNLTSCLRHTENKRKSTEACEPALIIYVYIDKRIYVCKQLCISPVERVSNACAAHAQEMHKSQENGTACKCHWCMHIILLRIRAFCAICVGGESWSYHRSSPVIIRRWLYRLHMLYYTTYTILYERPIADMLLWFFLFVILRDSMEYMQYWYSLNRYKPNIVHILDI